LQTSSPPLPPSAPPAELAANMTTDALQRLIAEWAAKPLLFVTEALGAEPYPWQHEVLQWLGNGEKRISVRSGHGVGKTTLEAWLALWFPLTRGDAKVGITAPAGPQLEVNLWPEIRKWTPRLRDRTRVGAWLASRMQINELEIAFVNENLVRARTARPDQPEALQGLHAGNVLILIDEASGIDERMYEANIGALSTEGAIQAIFSNPTRNSGYFHRTQHEQADRWKTLVVSSLDVPNAQGHIDDVIRHYGRDSNQYRVRVLGEFPQEGDDAVMPLHMIDAAMDRAGKVAPVEGIAPVWGVDVAWMGGDRSALAKRCGNELVEPVKWWSGNDPHQTALRIFEHWEQTDADMRPAAIMVDAIGMGAATYLKLRELGLPARMINVGEAAAASDRYMRLRDELWFRGRAWLQDGASILPRDNALKAELVSVTYAMTPTGKIKVESKEDMRRRGLRSPDLADAFLLTLAGGEHRRQPASKPGRYTARRGTPGSWMSS